MPPPLVTLVSYCTLERPYIADLVSNAVKFSDLVIVCMGTRLYNGRPEDPRAAFKAHILDGCDPAQRAKVLLQTYEVPIPSTSPSRSTNHLHNAARKAGYRRARSEYCGFAADFWVLFLDGDEVPDGDAVLDWWRHRAEFQPLDVRTVYKLSNYWAFLHPQLVSETTEDSIMLAHSSVLHDGVLSHPRERDGIYLWHWSTSDSGPPAPLGASGLRLSRDIKSLAGVPMFWHFSWVRGIDDLSAVFCDRAEDMGSEWWRRWTEGSDGKSGARKAMLAKVERWGHLGDCDWAARINQTFDEINATGAWPTRDFVHNYRLVWGGPPPIRARRC
jgi:hypothetical protein